MPTAQLPRRAADIFAATLDLLAEQGYDQLAIEAIAARSGVNKTTIYRWWPSKDAVLAAALVNSSALELSVPDTGSLRGDLLALARQIAALLSSAATGRLAVTVFSSFVDRPAVAAAVREFFADRLLREQPIFNRAAARGEISADTDSALVMNMLAGALWFHLIVRARSASDDWLDDLVAAILGGVGNQAV